MKYFEVTCGIRPFSQDAADVLSAMLAEIGFESFTVTDDGLLAYIQQSVWSEAEMQGVVRDFCLPGVEISYAVAEAPDEDWNQVWEEEGFQPVVVSEDIVVHDVKHNDVPPATYDILITPRLAFGTGSHETTRLILRTLARLDLEGKHVIDAGTGTGILAIMAVKRGAASVFAYDIDEWSVENTKDNLLLNRISTKDLKDLKDFKDLKVPCALPSSGFVAVACGDSSLLEGCEKADLLIANINRNILLADLPRFAASLKPKGQMILSGFYLSDVPALTKATVQHGFSLLHTENEGEWAMLLFEANALGGRDV